MEQIINIDMFKENPAFFFEQLPEKAKNEFQSLLEFIYFKYNLKYKYQDDIKINKFKLFKENPIKTEKIIKYTREELHER